MKPIITHILAIAAALLVGAQAFAQSFPAKPVKLIVAFPPGGGADTLGRIVGAALSKAWKQPVIVENKAGAGSTIGAAYVANSPADGYTLYITGVGVHATSSIVYEKVISFDPMKSFTHISKVTTAPFIFVVHLGVKATSINELIELGRAKPQFLTYGSSGSGATPHLLSEMLAKAGGVKFVHVPYKGIGPATTALLAGQVDFEVADPGTVMSFVRAGRLRALSITSRKRSVLVPGVPTMTESGIPNFEIAQDFGIWGPAGMPRSIVDNINGQLNKLLAVEEVRQSLLALGVEPEGGTPEELAQSVALEVKRYSQLVRDLGVKVD